ncbi:hypothetical protein [Candidatus Enterococcus clewellii]|uniref:hypothetical protein n=1 Tax=Candidatus Enterococcus clewellii TaxID=1834193 RepID=UPI000A33BDE5
MHKRNSDFRRYTLLYRIHFIASCVLLLIFGIAFFFCYFTDFQEKMTLAHLILLMLLVMLMIFFRMNACHYQRYIWKEAQATRIRVSRERQQYLRGEQSFYD